MKKDGFTLMEIMVVIGLIVIIASFAIPGFIRWMPFHRLKNAAADLYSTMQEAKMNAIRDRAEWTVVFNTGNGTYQLVSGGANRVYEGGGDDVVQKTVTLADYLSGIGYGHGNASSPVGASFGDEVTFSSNLVTFNPRGMIESTTGGYVYIANERNQTYAVGALSTGVVMLKKWNGSAWN